MKTTGKNERNGFRILALVLALAISGCASSPSPVYYTLASNLDEAARSTSNIAAEIGPFELPEYLDRPQIVTAGPGATISLDEFHRWIEPLDEMFVRTLATSVARELGSDQVFSSASRRGFDVPYRAHGSVLRFETNSEGRAILEVQWTIVDGDGNIVKPGRRTRYAADTGDPADIGARVSALGEVLEMFAADIAIALQDRPRP